MKRSIFILSLALAAFTACVAFVIPVAPNWNIDSKYSVKFTAGSFKGSIKGLKGSIVFDENDLAGASFNVKFDVNTIDLGNSENTNQAKDKDRLDVKNHTYIDFTSTTFSKTGKGYEVKGSLTIKGVTKSISFPFTFAKKSKAGTFKGSFKISPADFGIAEEEISSGIKIDFVIPVKQ
jgi:polyisoprenoid-binding protein YceI